jgi:hypothetical protein
MPSKREQGEIYLYNFVVLDLGARTPFVISFNPKDFRYAELQ